MARTIYFKLKTSNYPVAYFLQSGRGKDLIGKSGRAIRYCRNQKSIYLDEQDKNAISTDIEFADGILSVDAELQKNLVDFLFEHPSYGVVFEQLDFEKQAQEQTDREDKIAMAKAEVLKLIEKAKNKGQKQSPELLAIATNIMGSFAQVHDKSNVELKKIIYDDINENLDKYFDGDVVRLYDNKTLNYFIAISALDTEVIKLNADKTEFTFADGAELLSVNPAMAIEQLVEFLMSDKGSAYAEKIAELVKQKKQSLSPSTPTIKTNVNNVLKK